MDKTLKSQIYLQILLFISVFTKTLKNISTQLSHQKEQNKNHAVAENLTYSSFQTLISHTRARAHTQNQKSELILKKKK